jgi:unsaturated rhamnogalacturonyl hydrolase
MSLLVNPTEDPLVGRVLVTLMAMQRYSWEQGVASHALLDLGQDALVELMARDAVTHQSADGALADLREQGVNDSGAVGEAVLWTARRTGDDQLQQAFDRQVSWLLVHGPRAADGTLFHLRNRQECWVDSVYMLVPVLVVAGHLDEAARQLDGHRRRLFNPEAGLYGWRWDETAGRLSHPQHWGTGNGWVVAGIARTLRLLAGSEDADSPFARDAAAHAQTVMDACLAYRRPDGSFSDVVDDPNTFEENNLAQMLAFACFSGAADGWLPAHYAETGADLLRHARGKVDELGFVTPVCGAPNFDRPGTSAEAQSFFLLAHAASRRCGAMTGQED